MASVRSPVNRMTKKKKKNENQASVPWLVSIAHVPVYAHLTNATLKRMNIYECGIKLTAVIHVRYHLMSVASVETSRSRRDVEKSPYQDIESRYRAPEILILFENNDTGRTRKSTSLQDYGITGEGRREGGRRRFSRVSTRDPLIIALFEACRYAFLRCSFIRRCLKLTREDSI